MLSFLSLTSVLIVALFLPALSLLAFEKIRNKMCNRDQEGVLIVAINQTYPSSVGKKIAKKLPKHWFLNK